MKTTLSKILITTIISPALILLTVSPAMAVVAPKTTTTNPDANINIDAGNCFHVVSLRTSGRDGFATHLTKMNAASSDRMKKIATDKTGVDKKLTVARGDTKKQFEEKIANLEKTAGLTDAQKQAIETYKTNMEMAKANREFAVDKARDDYNIALSTALVEQQTSLSNAVIAYQTAFEKVFATATSSCAKTTDMSTVKSAVQTARKDLKTAIAKSKTSEKIQQLVTVRNNAIQAAKDNFVKQATSFTKTLKTALGE